MSRKIALGAVLVMLSASVLFHVSIMVAKGFDGQIKIGIIGPVGLPHWSPAGMKEAAEMARDEINAAGGVHLSSGDYAIVLAFGDEHSHPTPSPSDAMVEMNRLISQEGCELIIGGFQTECTSAMIEIAADSAVPFFIVGASADDLISARVPVNYQRYKYLFRVMPTNSSTLLNSLCALYQYILQQEFVYRYGEYLWPNAPNPQVKVAVLSEDLEWTATMHESLTNPAVYPSLLGPYANVTYAARIPDGTFDCSPWLSNVAASGAKLLIHLFSGITGVYLIIQRDAMGVEALPVGINAAAQLQSHWGNTGGACENETIVSMAGKRTTIVPGLTDVFWDNFVAKTGVWPLYTAWGAYDAIYMLKEAFEAIDSTNKDTLVAYLENSSRTGLSGRFKFDSSHDVYTSELGPFWTQGYVRPFIVQWQNGSPEVVCPIDQIYSESLLPWMPNIILVPEDYPTVQQAIDNAKVGDYISIADGTYPETLIVDKRLTIFGRRGHTPIFEGGGSGIAIILLPHSSGSTIKDIIITDYDKGMLIFDCSDCKIYDTSISNTDFSGIEVEGNSADNLIFSNIFEDANVAINISELSGSNVIYNNSISISSIGLKLESSGHTICANTISMNDFGISLSSSEGNIIYWNNFIGNDVHTVTDISMNTWDRGYPLGGNYWSSHESPDLYGGPNQNISGGDGICDDPYIIDSNNIDNYPLRYPWTPSLDNLALINVVLAKRVVMQEHTMSIKVIGANQGDQVQAFDFSIYANAILINTTEMFLSNGTATIISVTWNTDGLAKGNYTIGVYLEPIPTETDIIDNSFVENWVIITMVGDITGPEGYPDGKCDIRDVAMVARLYGINYPDPRYDPNCDLTGPTLGVPDGKIDIRDVALVAIHYGEIDP